MRPPQGFRPPHSTLVCKLRNSLYGLREAPRQWFFKLASALKDYEFRQSLLDHSLFVYHNGDQFLALLIYADDLILTCGSLIHCQTFKQFLHQCFKLKDLRPLRYVFGDGRLAPPKAYSFVNASMY